MYLTMKTIYTRHQCTQFKSKSFVGIASRKTKSPSERKVDVIGKAALAPKCRSLIRHRLHHRRRRRLMSASLEALLFRRHHMYLSVFCHQSVTHPSLKSHLLRIVKEIDQASSGPSLSRRLYTQISIIITVPQCVP